MLLVAVKLQCLQAMAYGAVLRTEHAAGESLSLIPALRIASLRGGGKRRRVPWKVQHVM